MGEFVQEITMATKDGFKSRHDDAVDTISMLQYLNPWKPSDEIRPPAGSDHWDMDDDDVSDTDNPMSSYIV